MKSTFKNVYVLGDSYSTFEGWVPEGYSLYYYPAGDHIDLRKVEQTWWHKIITETDSRLVKNNSWSGSTVCYMGYGGRAPEQSFYTRVSNDFESGKVNGERVDTAFVFGCMNDSWNDSPVGETKYSDWTEEDMCSCLPAFCRTLAVIREKSPETRIICIINYTMIKEEIVAGMRQACSHYGAETVDVDNFDTTNGHPTISGMQTIVNQIYTALGVID